MQVRHGWSAEVAPNRWAKFDITLEEEDLRRLVGAELREGVTTSEAYQLMELEAERLVMAKLVQRYGYDAAEGRQIITALQGQITALIRKVAGEAAPA